MYFPPKKDAMDFELKKTEENGQERYLLLNKAGSMYQLSAVLYQVLLQHKSGKSAGDIAAAMNVLHNTTSFTPAFVENTLNQVLTSVHTEPVATPTEQHYVHLRVPLIKEGRLHGLYRVLAALFQPQLFTFLFCFSVAATFLFLYNQHLLSPAALWKHSVTQLSPGAMLVVYPLFMFIILLHEVGHASAAFSFGIRPREIGMCLYFIFPVLYANVSDVWQLSAGKRNVVNIGGIYFQLLVNVILISCFYTNISQPLLCTLIISNTISMVISLIPFFRYDGYWLFSDYFNIPNLRTKSAALGAGLLLGGIGKWRQLKGSLPLALHFYTLAGIVFWLFVYAEVASLIVNNCRTLFAHVQQRGFAYVTVTLPGVLAACVTVVSIWVLIKHAVQLYKLCSNEQKTIPGRKEAYSSWHLA